MKTIISDKESLYIQAAGEIKSLLDKKPDAVIALSAERDLLPLYDRLARMHRAGECGLSRARFFAMAEYVDAPEGKSCRETLEKSLFAPAGLDSASLFVPSPDSPENCDAALAALGGIDLALADIGTRAQLGFNEPSTPFMSLTRIQKLSPAASEQRAADFGSAETVPEKAVTMGIKTICSAKNILLIATGAEKAQAVHKMLYGRNDSVAPAAFLQIPLNVKIYLDEQASSAL